MSNSKIQKLSIDRSLYATKFIHSDIKKMLNYVKRKKGQPMPSAKKYYETMLQETGIEGIWQNLRFQLQFLKMTLSRANSWMDTVDFTINDKKDVIDYARCSYCPHYDQLVEIFGSDFHLDVWNEHSNTSCSSSNKNEESIETANSKNQAGPSKPKASRKENFLKADKWQIENDYHQMAKEKKKKEIEKKKVENELILRKLELEEKERIALYEIKMKYN